MTRILAIDPGPTQSAWLLFERGAGPVLGFGKCSNEDLLRDLQLAPRADRVVIEKVESFGMAVGAEVFETVYWSGRFAQAADPLPVERLGRKTVKLLLCGSHRAKDTNIRQALLDWFGGPSAVGRKHQPGPLYGISGDVWSALAVAVAYAEGAR